MWKIKNKKKKEQKKKCKRWQVRSDSSITANLLSKNKIISPPRNIKNKVNNFKNIIRIRVSMKFYKKTYVRLLKNL